MSLQCYLSTFKKLQIGGREIEYVQDYKYLGLTIDMQLKFVKYTNLLINNVSHRISTLSRIRASITKDTALTLYKSMILTLFDYGCISYRSTNSSLVNKLQTLQNKAIRIICGLPKYENTDTLHKKLRSFLKTVEIFNCYLWILTYHSNLTLKLTTD